MIKNLIIIILIYIVGSLLLASSSNVDLLKKEVAGVKEFIQKGVDYVYDKLVVKDESIEDAFVDDKYKD